jgi:hypothetical protein
MLKNCVLRCVPLTGTVKRFATETAGARTSRKSSAPIRLADGTARSCSRAYASPPPGSPDRRGLDLTPRLVGDFQEAVQTVQVDLQGACGCDGSYVPSRTFDHSCRLFGRRGERGSRCRATNISLIILVSAASAISTPTPLRCFLLPLRHDADAQQSRRVREPRTCDWESEAL